MSGSRYYYIRAHGQSGASRTSDHGGDQAACWRDAGWSRMSEDQINLGLLILRVAVGGTMVAHGVNHVWRGGKIAGTGRWFASLGMKPGVLHAWLASGTELVAGAALDHRVVHAVRGRRVRGRDARRADRQPPQERVLHLPARRRVGVRRQPRRGVLRDRVPRCRRVVARQRRRLRPVAAGGA